MELDYNVGNWLVLEVKVATTQYKMYKNGDP